MITAKSQYSFLRSIVQTVVEISGTMSIQDMSNFVSSFYALVLLHKNLPESFYIEDFEVEYNALNDNFPDLFSSFKATLSKINKENVERLYNSLRKAESFTDLNCDNNISWLYQLLKRDLEKSAFNKIGENKNKIEGKDLLYTTQFFTDEYMVKYLVDTCIKENGEHVGDLVFVDTSMGGGNFLTYAFAAMYEWYIENTNKRPDEIVSIIIGEQLVGYDLDPHLPIIASLSLYVNVALKTNIYKIPTISFYSGKDKDIYGYMAEKIISNKINKWGFQEHINNLKLSSKRIIYVTNPPFMGKRDMEPKLKNHLLSLFPQCKGDLCFSFLAKLLNQLRSHDLLAVVAQNGWMNLSSLKKFRETVLDNCHIDYCADLGSNAFFAINGEKTNIVLSIISKKRESLSSIFYNLRGLSYNEKSKYLLNGEKLEKIRYVIDQQEFKKNPSYELSYELVNSFMSLNTLDTYSKFAKTMQGSSTGNNSEFVKYVWDSKANGKEWKLVSKGGGFSKWQGLNIYKVKWGNNGDLIANNPGSALRNVKEMPSTELVYSDTGTLGLNVRLLLSGQVFIASGPGIKVLEGNKYCHLAFLNSKIATCILKIKNPKFTISAGYIGQLPVKGEIFKSDDLAKYAKKMIKLKATFLSSKVPNSEFSHSDYDAITDLDGYINQLIIADFKNYYKRKVVEDKIDCIILDFYKFSNPQLELVSQMLGLPPEPKGKMSIPEFDKFFSSQMTEGCVTISRKLNGCISGSENLLESASYEFGFSVGAIYRLLSRNVNDFILLRKMYKQDLIHKLTLKVCGINDLKSGCSKVVDPISVVKKLRKEYPYLYEKLLISQEVIVDVITRLHFKCFMNTPILKIK